MSRIFLPENQYCLNGQLADHAHQTVSRIKAGIFFKNQGNLKNVRNNNQIKEICLKLENFTDRLKIIHLGCLVNVNKQTNGFKS